MPRTAPGALALRLRLVGGRRRSTAERHPMADWDLTAGSRLTEADRMAAAEGISRWIARMAAVADRMAAVADRMVAAVIVTEIASRGRLRGGTGEPETREQRARICAATRDLG